MNTAEDGENVSFWLLGFVRENSVDVVTIMPNSGQDSMPNNSQGDRLV
jgi:hypothetical protein